MADFSYLKQLEVSATRTSEYILHEVEGAPFLILHPATEANKPYFNAVLKRSRRYGRAIQQGNMTPEIISENREEDRALYPKHIIAGWGKVKDSGGKDVKFSKQHCEQLLKAIPNWVFDNLRMYAANPANFIDDQENIDTAGAAKNLPSD